MPRWLHAVILRGLQPDPARRFGSMGELLDALEQDPARRYRAWAGEPSSRLRRSPQCLRTEGIRPRFGGNANKATRSSSLTCLGEVELARRQFDAAIRHFEQSVSLPLRNEPSDLPRARFALAKGLRAARRDPDRATKLAESALEEFRKLPGTPEEIAAAEQWLSAGAPRRPPDP